MRHVDRMISWYNHIKKTYDYFQRNEMLFLVPDLNNLSDVKFKEMWDKIKF